MSADGEKGTRAVRDHVVDGDLASPAGAIPGTTQALTSKNATGFGWSESPDTNRCEIPDVGGNGHN